MQCPFCKADEDRVLDSRSLGEGSAIRRRRNCLVCGKRFTTYERPEVAPRMVVKKDSRREMFSRDKILHGLIKACHKRNISVHELENVAAKIEAELWEEYDSEVSTKVIGERVSEALKGIDHVAFVRFASIYREFKDVKEFLSELLPLVRAQDLREGLAQDGGGSPGPAGCEPTRGASGPPKVERDGSRQDSRQDSRQETRQDARQESSPREATSDTARRRAAGAGPARAPGRASGRGSRRGP